MQRNVSGILRFFAARSLLFSARGSALAETVSHGTSCPGTLTSPAAQLRTASLNVNLKINRAAGSPVRVPAGQEQGKPGGGAPA